MSFGVPLSDIFFQHAPSYVELDLIFKFKSIVCGVAIVLVKRVISCFVNIRTVGNWIGSLEIKLICNGIQYLCLFDRQWRVTLKLLVDRLLWRLGPMTYPASL